MTGDLVQLALSHERRFCQHTAALCFYVLDPALEYLDSLCALGEKNRQTLTDIVNGGEILKLSAYLVVVAALSVLECFKMSVERVL